MSNLNNTIDNLDIPNLDLRHDLEMRKLKEELAKSFSMYRKTINYMACDAPIEILCLPTVIENALLAHGCLRIYDLFDLDFTKVKGLGVSRIRDLTALFEQFLAML